MPSSNLTVVSVLLLLCVITPADSSKQTCPAGKSRRSLASRQLQETAIITNGVVKLGLFGTGNLAVGGGNYDFYEETEDVGLRYIIEPGFELESIALGCFCEGWGASAKADDGDLVGNAYANDSDGGDFGLTLEKFEYDATTAKSTISFVDYPMKITHYFTPAPETPNLYRIAVTYTNEGSMTLSNLRYRRVIDWDVPPNYFDECVSIDTGMSPDVIFASDDGFAVSSVFSGETSIEFECTEDCVVLDNGPTDHGAMFDFRFKDDSGSLLELAPGESFTFYLYYGGAPTRDEVLDSLSKVGAETYTYADSCTSRDADGAVTAAFALGYSRTVCENDSYDFVVWDAKTNMAVGPLEDEIDLCLYPDGFSIEVVIPCGNADKVKFVLYNGRGEQVYRTTEGDSPYQLGNDMNEPYDVLPVEQFTKYPNRKYTVEAKISFTSGPRETVMSPTFKVKACS